MSMTHYNHNYVKIFMHVCKNYYGKSAGILGCEFFWQDLPKSALVNYTMVSGQLLHHTYETG